MSISRPIVGVLAALLPIPPSLTFACHIQTALEREALTTLLDELSTAQALRTLADAFGRKAEAVGKRHDESKDNEAAAARPQLSQ